jgi:hypothetical protein
MYSNQNLPENQCIFIRGFRATRLLGILPKLRGAAEPTQSPDEDEDESEHDMRLMTTPDIKVMHIAPGLIFRICLTPRSLRIPFTHSLSTLLRCVICVLVPS